MSDPLPNTQAQPPAPYEPTLRDMIMLQVPVAVQVSPGGRRVAIAVRTTNWKDNRYETICHVHDLEAGTTYPLNRSGSVTQMEWLDDRSLALLKGGPGDDDKAQVWLYEGLTGEGWPLTDHKTGVEWFKPFAGGILYRARHPERDENRARAERFGKFTHLEQEDSASALYYAGLEPLRQHRAALKAATEDEAKELVAPVVELSRLLERPLAIRAAIPSPAGDAVYVNAWAREDMVYSRDTSAFAIRLDPDAALAEHVRREKTKARSPEKAAGDETEEQEDLSYLGQITRLHVPRGAAISAVSPDGSRLLIAYQERDARMFTRYDLATIDVQAALQAPDPAAFAAALRNISRALDRDMMECFWTERGIVAACVDGQQLRVARMDEAGPPALLDLGDVYLAGQLHATAGGWLGLVGTNAHTYPEAYIATPGKPGGAWRVKQLTEFGAQVDGWSMGTIEPIRWTSRDGTQIEGVLRKPPNFDPAGRYPLVFVVHGGPRWVSPEYLLAYEDFGYYPTVQFANKDVLVLKPNYRGSTGRGQAFSELNVDNLGVGDLWDLESAIDHLAALGWIDPERVGCMGWSQGGYISAFAGLQSRAFKAVSVGAGVSDWYTYHISNDIPDFTVDYLSGSPFRDRELYIKTAPIANLAQAATPMLVQHGSDDRRVPLSNAMELYRGLKEMGVPVEVFIFPGMAHPITKPRENHAVMHQNLAWFSHYLLGEDLELE